MDVYRSQGGDTLNIIATRFGIDPRQIVAETVLPAPDELIPYNTLMLMPKVNPAEQRSPGERSIPDSEVVLGPSSLGFYIQEFITQQNGYLATYKSYMTSETTTGVEAVERISQENSLSPRILLAIIEYESHWVLGQPTNMAQDEYPLGYVDIQYRGLFRQLMWASGTLSDGYYRWRSGKLTDITFPDGTSLRLNPNLNAGTAAIQFYFAQAHNRAEWEQAVGPNGFAALYERMFGPTQLRAAPFEPSIPTGLVQPELSLPFEPGKVWAFSGGPHSAWEEKGALAALDFAPASEEHGCATSNAWVVAPADGIVARTDKGVVIFDLDGDGFEQTGWNILFMHIRSDGKAFTGQMLKKGDHIGHPSCEGGISTGTHLHIARKFNGEWMLAEGPLGFNFDGWVAHNGPVPYKGTLTRDGVVIEANTSGSFETRIIRDK
jgi:murein DD-endopeptidase MepM/ murein hydrolase activator NlpD